MVRPIRDGFGRELPSGLSLGVEDSRTDILTARRHRKALMSLPGKWIDRVRQRRSLDELVLDLDSSVSETYGRQEGSA